TETLGALTLGAGNSTIAAANGAGQTAALTFASLARNAGATANFANAVGATTGAALGSASNQVLFTAAPTLAAGVNILPYALVGGSNFATYGAGGVAANSNFVTTLAGATSTTNVVLTDAGAVAGVANVGSLILAGNTTLNNAGNTMTFG